MQPVLHHREVHPILARVPSQIQPDKRKLLRSFILAALAVALTLPTGCIFSPEKGKDPPPDPRPEYEIPRFPYAVLRNLVKAYEARDSVQYKLIYDPSYEGKSTNANDPDPATQISTFRWADEVAHLAEMARSTNITDVTMELGPETAWRREQSDLVAHPDWALIQLANFYSITIYATPANYNVSYQPGDQLKFYFNPTTPAPSSSTDTLWSIIYWEEFGSVRPDS